MAKHFILKYATHKNKILDIGCGAYPFFLSKIDFKDKYALDKISIKNLPHNIHLINQDLNDNNKLSLDNNFFDVVTSLAFIEHINPENRKKIFCDIYRVLKKDGVFILTTPSKWTDKFLKLLSKINIVSKEELDEHKDLFTPNKLKKLLLDSGFKRKNIKSGRFEFGMNLYTIAVK